MLEQLEPISARHGLAEAAGMKDLICQHKEVQQQIAEAKQRVARLQLVEEVERRQHSYESWLEHGTTATEARLDSLTELCCMMYDAAEDQMQKQLGCCVSLGLNATSRKHALCIKSSK